MTAQRPTAIEVLAIRPLDGVKAFVDVKSAA
jgi:hypothetical protein